MLPGRMPLHTCAQASAARQHNSSNIIFTSSGKCCEVYRTIASVEMKTEHCYWAQGRWCCVLVHRRPHLF